MTRHLSSVPVAFVALQQPLGSEQQVDREKIPVKANVSARQRTRRLLPCRIDAEASAQDVGRRRAAVVRHGRCRFPIGVLEPIREREVVSRKVGASPAERFVAVACDMPERYDRQQASQRLGRCLGSGVRSGRELRGPGPHVVLFEAAAPLQHAVAPSAVARHEAHLLVVEIRQARLRGVLLLGEFHIVYAQSFDPAGESSAVGMCGEEGEEAAGRLVATFSTAEKSYAALRFHGSVRCSGLRQRGNRFVAEARVSVLVAEVPGGVLRSQRIEPCLRQ